MKAEQWTATDDSAESGPRSGARIAPTARKLQAKGLIVVDRARSTIDEMPDRDLAYAAYNQAVALYDSCVQYASALGLASGARRASQPAPQCEP